ncbi:hypothetical protein SELSPUOL_02568 [Selenomonas sputigena ATCC 35185]|uniref:Uncharacterized protein n=1 Tax=Selenomonas sputigena (strain ATCC 35185 / DSM 20758 / CCUG 44933 / VPI D19B-28) TaxID=546271 RepID=C9LYK7_SELS3|nr:hypothetical protein SELSPUOL_02568 [Selenomonas sputigena ATCC 35185]
MGILTACRFFRWKPYDILCGGEDAHRIASNLFFEQGNAFF